MTSNERWEATHNKKTEKYLVKGGAYDARKRFKFIYPKQGRKPNPLFGR